ncbi:MAG: class B sortase [Firmicutes bacterium]|nr:class B sortase [Bacillota bacterium]
MSLHRLVLRTANGLWSLAVSLLLFVAIAYSAFALWDNGRVYAAAGNVQADMQKIKPQILQTERSGSGGDFSELLRVNPDVCGWLTLDGTQIDYPVLQGSSNASYINTDVYGNFSLAGSIFLDSRNSRGFTDPYNLIYGHHMADRKMFGDLDFYKEEAFFRENTTGTLITPDGTYQLEILACLLVPASEKRIFAPEEWQDQNRSRFLAFVKESALQLRGELLTGLTASEEPFRLLALSTCSYEFTDARTIVLAVMKPEE